MSQNKRILRAGYILPALVFLIPLLIYSITLRGSFVYDDNIQIINNPWIRDLGKIPTLFVSSTMSFLANQPANTYRPVFYLVYMAEYLVFGLRPWAWHLVNVLFHSMNALALYFLVSLFLKKDHGSNSASTSRELPRLGAAAIAALIFALHPVNSEVVAWVGAIPELVYTLMVLSSFILYILADRTERRRAALYRAGSVAAFSVALLSKETAMALIIIIPLYEFSRLGLRCLKRWRIYLCYLIPAVFYMAMRTYALGGMTQMSLIKMSFYEGLINVPPLVARYLGKLLLPVGLSVIYSFEPVHSALSFMFILGLLASTAFGLLICYMYMRNKKKESFFLIWILIPLLPVLYMPILSVGGFADRYLYLSTVGFAAFIGLLIFRIHGGKEGDNGAIDGGQYRPLTITVMVIILLFYSAGSIKRAFVWHNDYSLWSDTVLKSPESPNALYNLAWVLHKRGGPGNLDKALKLYEEAIRVKPDKEDAHYNAALIYDKRGEYGKALKHYMASLRLKPSSATSYNIAMIYQGLNRLAPAIKFYNLAIKLNPDNEDAHYNLAWAYQESGYYSKAIAHYRAVLRLSPRSADAHYKIGVIYEERGMIEEALSEFKNALSADPGYGPARLKVRELIGGDR